MAQKPKKLFKIGEVMEFSGLSRQTLHNYTMLGLIRPAARTKFGHRLYDEGVFDVIERIKELREKLTLEDIRQQFNGEAKRQPEPTGS